MYVSSEDKKQPVTVAFRKPAVYPGTSEAVKAGCLCDFERHMRAGFLPAERGDVDGDYVVINANCPLHKIVPKPLDDVL